VKPAPSRFRLEASGLARLPRLAPGMRIGLYGGSFNPAHEGHRHVSLLALRRLGLDRVWWIVTPGNPLKSLSDLAPTALRVAEAEKVAAHPRIDVTTFEEDIRSRYTVDTLAYLVRRHPDVRFVWIMGADSLASFHRWRGWRRIARMMPFAVVDRPGWTLKALRSHGAQALAAWRIGENRASVLADMRAPAWVFLHGPRSPASSTAIRRMRRTSPSEGR